MVASLIELEREIKHAADNSTPLIIQNVLSRISSDDNEVWACNKLYTLYRFYAVLKRWNNCESIDSITLFYSAYVKSRLLIRRLKTYISTLSIKSKDYSYLFQGIPKFRPGSNMIEFYHQEIVKIELEIDLKFSHLSK
jgi:hypothetical protein